MAAVSLIDWIFSPAVGLSLFLALIYTLAVHLFMGLGYKRLWWHWLLAMAGMAAGYGLAIKAGSHLPMVGDVHVVESSVAALVLLMLAALRARVAPIPTPVPSTDEAS